MLCSASKEKKSDENYWVVGLNANKLFCVVCKSPDLFPQVVIVIAYFLSTLLYVSHLLTFSSFQVMPKPVLSLLNLSFPLASSDLGAEALENEFMLNSMHLSQVCPPSSGVPHQIAYDTCLLRTLVFDKRNCLYNFLDGFF